MKTIKQLLEMAIRTKHGGGFGSGTPPTDPPDDDGPPEYEGPDMHDLFVHHHKYWDRTVDKDVTLTPHEEEHSHEIHEDMDKYRGAVDKVALNNMRIPVSKIASHPKLLHIMDHHFDKSGHIPFHNFGGGKNVGAVFTDHHFEHIDEDFPVNTLHTVQGHTDGHHGNRPLAVDIAKEIKKDRGYQHPIVDTVMHMTIQNNPGGEMPTVIRTPAAERSGQTMLRHGTVIEHLGHRYIGHEGETVEPLNAIQHPHKVAYKQRMWASIGNEADDMDTYTDDNHVHD